MVWKVSAVEEGNPFTAVDVRAERVKEHYYEPYRALLRFMDGGLGCDRHELLGIDFVDGFRSQFGDGQPFTAPLHRL